MKESLLSVRNLTVEFTTRSGVVPVIDDLSFDLAPGETLSLVGESGCGKSMTALAIMGLIPSPPGRFTSGSISLLGEDLIRATNARMLEIRGNEVSMVFQEPMTSLNPVFTIGMQMVLMPQDGDQVVPFAKLGRELGVDYAVVKHCSDDEYGSLGVDYSKYKELYGIMQIV